MGSYNVKYEAQGTVGHVDYRAHLREETLNATPTGSRLRPTGPALALAAVAVTGSLMAGCSSDTAACGPVPSAEVSQADLYGSYAGPHGARLDLTAVGGTSVTFSVRHWPIEGSPTFDGGGVWKLLNPPGEDGEVRLAFDDLDTSARGATVTELLVGKERGRTVLFARPGDPDVCRVFKLTS